MKTLFWNYVYRWRWILAGIFCFLLLQSVVLLGNEEIGAGFLFGGVIFGPVLLSLDLARGSLRVERSLPFTKKEMGYQIWARGVLFPAFSIIIIILSIAIIYSLFNPGSPTINMKIIYLIPWCFVFCGALFTLFSFVPQGPPNGIWANIKSAIFGGFWGLSIFGGFYLFLWLNRIKNIGGWEVYLLFLLLSTLTVWSWFRANHLVDDKVSIINKAVSKSQKSPITFSGKNAGIYKSYLKVISQGFLMVSMFFVFFKIFGFFSGSSIFEKCFESFDYSHGFSFMFSLFFCFAGSMSILSPQSLSLKAQRALPLSSKNFAISYYLVPLLFCLSFFSGYGVLILISGGTIDPTTFFHTLIFSIGALFLLTTFLLRWGLKSIIFLIFSLNGVFIALLTTSILSGSQIFNSFSPQHTLFPAGLLMVTASFLWGTHTLKNNSQIYRERKLPMGMGIRWN